MFGDDFCGFGGGPLGRLVGGSFFLGVQKSTDGVSTGWMIFRLYFKSIKMSCSGF